MSTIIGRVASLVARPTRISRPHPISKKAVEIGEEGASGDTGLGEAARTEGVRPNELQDALDDEDRPTKRRMRMIALSDMPVDRRVGYTAAV